MKNVTTMLLILICQIAFSQKSSGDSVSKEINQLIFDKIRFEKFESYTEKNPERYTMTKDSAYRIYISQINKIKDEPGIYLKYIDSAILKPELAEDRVFYNYVNTTMPFDPNEYVISRQDLYKVIKYSLFEQNADVLPERLDDIPFSVKRNYNEPFKLQTQEDIMKNNIKKKAQ